MWIPRPIYERAPLFWLLLGVLLLAGGVFLGLGFERKIAHFVFAAFCFGQAAWTSIARRRSRHKADQPGPSAVEPIEP